MRPYQKGRPELIRTVRRRSQYFTWADSWGGSYRPPRPDLDPIHDAIKNMERKRKLAEKDQQREAVASATSADERVTVVLDGADSDSGYEGSEAEGEQLDKWTGKKAGQGQGETEARRRR